MKHSLQISKLPPSYLFIEINKRCQAFKERFPEKELLKLGIGDVTLPLSPVIAEAMALKARAMATIEGMRGYGSEHGNKTLAQAIASSIYSNRIDHDEICIQDGSKPALARTLAAFKKGSRIGLLSPSFPAFFDSAACHIDDVEFIHIPFYKKDSADLLKSIKESQLDLLIICHPNNPDGHVFDRLFLKELTLLAKKNNFFILHDSAYRSFIDVSPVKPSPLRSFYEMSAEVPEVKEVVIEIGSLSKSHGFTGLRLGWVCLPKALMEKQLRKNMLRLYECSFNGASSLSQEAALTALTNETAQLQAKEQCLQYMNHQHILSECLKKIGWHVKEPSLTPYVWARPRVAKTSWQIFEELLLEKSIVSTPGVGFDPKADGWIRLSGFAPSHVIAKACQALTN